ncbi:DUF1850 domain-containing protein [Paracoccus fistulariae]|uniref:DUF1850 domain-containing protein n=1 Tax=Paracoccus fistulariae TaxID=658446 RepID=A0ABY7SHL4_9RHOB|nr:DUF1850 domain-containing protein [Paracoccus fistulariae]MDB6181092.1 DUF1850 domain-containing protein [Paracoccus fistulariae]WCR06384.1 DUF1850 domain-containing protein [Paracoccus fistulariae]
MSGCLMAGALAIALGPGQDFALTWTHSVEKIGWHESWELTPQGLQLTGAAVRGSGAGMEPGPDARLVDGWLVWEPQLPPIPELVLAASGATGDGWRLCGTECVTLAARAGQPVILKPCPGSSARP